MKKKIFMTLVAAAMAATVFTACGGGEAAPAPAAEEAAEETEEVAEAEAEETEEVEAEAEETEEVEEEAAEGEEEVASDISYVDGFYANDGTKDFMIAFYESSDGDVAYVNDGENEAFAEYTVEEDTTDDGTAYLLVTVGGLKLGYIEDGDDIYLVDDEGSVYAAARLSEEEAEELHSIVTQ